MFFRRGTSHHDDPWLAEKLWLFTAGAVAAIAGMLLDSDWLMAVAALLLAAGVFIRFLPRGGDGGDGGDGGGRPRGPDRPDDGAPPV